MVVDMPAWKPLWDATIGKCKVEETEKGWFIKLIHKDAQQVRRE
jgi:hypothetical protein